MDHLWVQSMDNSGELQDAYFYTNCIFAVKKVKGERWVVFDVFSARPAEISPLFEAETLAEAKAWVEGRMSAAEI